MPRAHLIAIGLLALVLIGVLVLDHASANGTRPRTLAELQALPVEMLPRQVVDDLALVAFASGAPRDTWTRFNEPCRRVWALAIVESGSDGPGLAGFTRDHAADAGFPRIEDARDACLAMGLDDAAKALDADSTAQDASAAWFHALRQPDAVRRRLDYLQRNLALMAKPLSVAP
jgi:hypothetical protein